MLPELSAVGSHPLVDRRHKPANEVIELDHLDCFGRRQFVAVDEGSRELAHGVAVSDVEVERTIYRLYDLLVKHHLRPRLTLL